jgi:hypothetical protein
MCLQGWLGAAADAKHGEFEWMRREDDKEEE